VVERLIQNNMEKRIKARLEEKYQNEVAKTLKEEFGIKNIMAVPKIVKIVVNVGTGEAGKNKETMEAFIKDLSAICGQRPSIQKAKVSVASFGVREGMPVGLRVTLRGKRMYDFLDKLVSITLPRLRDFRGIPGKSFDKFGNYTLGVEEHIVFPEIDMTKVVKPFGFEITIVTSTKETDKARRLLELMGMPFEK